MPLRLVTLAACIAAGVLTGCDAPPPATSSTASTPPTPVPAAPAATATPDATATDAWIGQWTGPEGTFLRIEGTDAPGRYTITIHDLDQARRYEGRTDGQLIRFDRDGIDGSEATIRAGDGDATGMKWLAGKRDCLVIAIGEGYCRD
ncbi:MAG TPA: hypothetical protein VMR06_18055 [Dokdonella sp.]|uniref:hypothetical protein n=1 Tax=Dokdonella sp. TaxID=2291710 RepID=UPI002C9C257E|nr:hypothetical protein [Dokdonella sp.]HUD43892.1 hypothetical protein [Dokdonella sp.]